MEGIRLNNQLLLGSATAATQIEGGDKNSNWYYWSQQGKIANNESTIIAADHYNRYKEDITLMRELNQEIYRMSIEWSRIEPEQGKWSKDGMNHYLSEIQSLVEAGIKPLVTLHHFSHPQWFEEMGAWISSKSVYFFKRFVKKVIEFIGHEVNEYCTINEPNVFANDTYIDGKYPPGHKNDIKSYFKSAKNMILAHVEVYQLIHKMRKDMGYSDTMVGFAHHLAYFDCKDKTFFTKIVKKMLDYSFHRIFLLGMVEGKLPFPMGIKTPFRKGVYCDFIGVNYYSRHLIHKSNNPASLFGEVKVEENLPEDRVNDLGWEIYPKGLYYVIKELYDNYKLPIYITENGIPDRHDRKRAKFIFDHLLQVQQLIDDNVDIRRYYYWSLLDNLEWNDGYTPRFGLVEVDYKTLKRRIRKSGRFYGEICKTKEIRKEMIEEYIGR